MRHNKYIFMSARVLAIGNTVQELIAAASKTTRKSRRVILGKAVQIKLNSRNSRQLKRYMYR